MATHMTHEYWRDCSHRGAETRGRWAEMGGERSALACKFFLLVLRHLSRALLICFIARKETRRTLSPREAVLTFSVPLCARQDDGGKKTTRESSPSFELGGDDHAGNSFSSFSVIYVLLSVPIRLVIHTRPRHQYDARSRHLSPDRILLLGCPIHTTRGSSTTHSVLRSSPLLSSPPLPLQRAVEMELVPPPSLLPSLDLASTRYPSNFCFNLDPDIPQNLLLNKKINVLTNIPHSHT